MARELVLGLSMDPRSVAEMPWQEVHFWYAEAVARQKQLQQGK